MPFAPTVAHPVPEESAANRSAHMPGAEAALQPSSRSNGWVLSTAAVLTVCGLLTVWWMNVGF